MLKNPSRIILLTLSIFLIFGCAGKVQRMGADEVKDLSGKWNDTDSRLVSEEMVKDVLSRPWLSRFEAKQGRPPAVIIGKVRNKSHEHINVSTFVNDIEGELINSGLVDFVASRDERNEIREERQDMDINASENSRKEMGEEMGADFMLKGTFSTILDTDGKQQIRFYQIDLNLINLANNRKVWQGQKKIKKFITKASARR